MKESGSAGELKGKYKHAVLVSAALVKGDKAILASEFKTALKVTFSGSELTELILQSLLFDGYPTALEGLIVLKDLESENEFTAEEEVEAYSFDNVQLWRRRGEKLCELIYGRNYQKLLSNVESLSPILKEWMLCEGYGRVLGRGALSIDVREMGIIAILTVKNMPRQLHSHLKGALNVGIDRKALRASIRLCGRHTTSVNIGCALEVLDNAV